MIRVNPIIQKSMGLRDRLRKERGMSFRCNYISMSSRFSYFSDSSANNLSIRLVRGAK